MAKEPLTSNPKVYDLDRDPEPPKFVVALEDYERLQRQLAAALKGMSGKDAARAADETDGPPPVRRYVCESVNGEPFAMKEHPAGNWVRHEDVIKIVARHRRVDRRRTPRKI